MAEQKRIRRRDVRRMMRGERRKPREARHLSPEEQSRRHWARAWARRSRGLTSAA